MTGKVCETCGSVLVRRDRESLQRWTRRRFCNRQCVGQPRTATPPVVAERLRGHGLTARELQVVQLVARGMSNLEIGAELGLSPLTVKQHLRRIAAKLGIGDRAGIVCVAIMRGLLEVRVTGGVPAGFTRRLFEVLVLIARGRSNPEIADELGIGFETVKSRVRQLFKVLGVRGREEAVVAGFACGVLRMVRRPVRVAA